MNLASIWKTLALHLAGNAIKFDLLRCSREKKVALGDST
jgi:hypothetical protein